MITFKVPSELYGVTDCVITDIDHTLKTGYAPCGSGEDYKLTVSELTVLKHIKAGKLKPEDFVHTDKPKYSVIRSGIQQHITLIEAGLHVVLDGKYTPGKAYTLKCGARMVNVRCTSWFQDSCIKSSFKKIETE